MYSPVNQRSASGILSFNILFPPILMQTQYHKHIKPLHRSWYSYEQNRNNFILARNKKEEECLDGIPVVNNEQFECCYWDICLLTNLSCVERIDIWTSLQSLIHAEQSEYPYDFDCWRTSCISILSSSSPLTSPSHFQISTSTPNSLAHLLTTFTPNSNAHQNIRTPFPAPI